MTLLSPFLSGVPGWMRRPVLPAVLLAGAVAVSVATGQPAPADRASGVSVPVSAAIDVPAGLGNLLLVSAGTLVRFDVETGTITPVPMPPGQLALQAWPLRDADVVLTASPPPGAVGGPAAVPVPAGTAPPGPDLTDGTAASGADAAPPTPTWAYAIPRHGAPVRLGAAAAVVPAVDGTRVWLLHGDTATLVGLDGRATASWVRVPPGYRLIGATRLGPIATVGGADPLTVLLPADGGLPRWVANAEALDVADGVLLVHSEHRIGSVPLATGVPHWLPGLSAVSITGPGTLSPGAGSFAVQARVNEHARLVVGRMDATSTGDLRVVALEGGAALDRPPAPVWTEDGRVLAVRPDGRMVVYRPGDPRASVLSPQYHASGVAAVAPVAPNLPH
ncbi:MAG TPA: hypothetical protein VFX70_09340 [Mycobacteriales bacterium]|nr:hypothetical protein [Mycobacteriales bacterium]